MNFAAALTFLDELLHFNAAVLLDCLYTESPNSLIIVLSMYRPDTALEYLKLIFKWYSTELFS